MTSLAAFLLGSVMTIAAVWLFNRTFGFRAQTPDDYSDGPAFDLRRHLNGPMACDGVIYGPTGRVTSRFTADFEANWIGNTCRMAEHFRYDSGTVQDREWRLTLSDKRQFRRRSRRSGRLRERRSNRLRRAALLSYPPARKRGRACAGRGRLDVPSGQWDHRQPQPVPQIRYQGRRTGRHHATRNRTREETRSGLARPYTPNRSRREYQVIASVKSGARACFPPGKALTGRLPQRSNRPA